MISITQWISLLLGLTVMVFSWKWRKLKHFELVFPVLFLMGFHDFLFYGLLLIYRTLGYDTTTNLYPFSFFYFEVWSTVVRLHNLSSILIIMFVRHKQMKIFRKEEKKAIEILKRNGHSKQ